MKLIDIPAIFPAVIENGGGLQMKKHLSALAIIIALVLFPASCSNQKVDYVDDGITSMDFVDESDSESEYEGLYGEYIYPDHPVEALRTHLEKDIADRALPLKLGKTVQTESEWQNTTEFLIYFTDNSDNACAISFAQKSETAVDDFYSLDGKENPSFTCVFKDPDNFQDMITVLTSIILYVSPDLSLQEAQRLAVRQDNTLSIDGFSMPQDIGGYQIQAHYTNPYDYFTAAEFTAKMGVSVKALKQIWHTEIDFSQCEKLVEELDFEVLSNPYLLLTDDFQRNPSSSKMVYADFTVVDWWEYTEPIHGTPFTYVIVKTPHNQEYTLVLESYRTPYKFGIGEKYTFVITFSHSGTLIAYAVQHPEGV